MCKEKRPTTRPASCGRGLPPEKCAPTRGTDPKYAKLILASISARSQWDSEALTTFLGVTDWSLIRQLSHCAARDIRPLTSRVLVVGPAATWCCGSNGGERPKRAVKPASSQPLLYGKRATTRKASWACVCMYVAALRPLLPAQWGLE